MKAPRACQQCRESKRKCLRPNQTIGDPCEPCRKRKLPCTSLLARSPTSSQSLLPKPTVGLIGRHEDGAPVAMARAPTSDISVDVAVLLVDFVLDKLHNRPYTLFHPLKLRKQVRDGSVNKALLLAICSMGSRFAEDEDIRLLEIHWMNESKRLLLADLESQCVENIQTCVLIANLCSAHLNPSSEALFFRIAISLLQLMELGVPTVETNLIDLEVKRRLRWTLFMADRWSSSSLGLPRQISDTELAIDLPMDESVFESLTPEKTRLDDPWQPGIWAHKISLVQLFGPIQDLNRRSVNGSVTANEVERSVALLAQQLETWEWMLPLDVKMGDENFERHANRGTGGPFVALHLGYHHYATLLYFRFLEPLVPSSPTAGIYRDKCKFHASSYSKLVKLARQRENCEVIYPTVGHMTVVSSSVLLHTLLFGEEADIKSARDAMNSNFAAIVELRQYWLNTAPMINRLVAFQNFCLLSTDYRTHQLDDWMIRFLIEYALPLEEKDIQPVKSAMMSDMDGFSSRTQAFTEQGRYTSFTTQNSLDWGV
ncbi:fungal-specific transcription factor domain-containing protein [Dactylonectria estremocensis]|uniref:Fungal-specific transcription factor domain-containing protein n=1 Tax=Dactylonectria estremocensis TaxID=1079267 RepID=A0A9P9F1U5_9HYPO|nr:fungal-specific transcription factor domain-containing protein [Dactylonectria estremocensis]